MLVDSSIADGVFPTAGGNYSANVAGDPTAWKISTVYHDSCDPLDLDYCLCSERSFPVSEIQ